MFRIVGVGLLVLGLAGCATPADRAWWRSLAGMPAEPAQFHFDWQISGDPTLAPLQVFDDGDRVWLQYPAAQAYPALFEQAEAGERLLHPKREGDYLVVHGVPSRMLVRGGHLQAQVRRSPAPGVDTGVQGAAGAAPAQVVPVATPALSAALQPTLPPAAAAAPVAAPAARAHRQLPAHKMPGGTAPAPVAEPFRFEVTPADENLRRALGRWARRAGWTFDAEHWSVDVDIPLAGSAAFGTAFVPAVRELLAATELGERPLQPCFYANQVLRVVPLAQRCDRTRAPVATVAGAPR